MSRMVTSISILKSLVEEADKAAQTGKYPGVANRSAIIELALDRLLHPEKYLETALEQVEATVPP